MIPQHYPIEPGRLYAGEYPGSTNPEEAVAKIRHLAGLGIRTFLDLTTPDDGLAPYAHALAIISEEIGEPLRRVALPIPDRSIPKVRTDMMMGMCVIKAALKQNPAVYIHCWGGIGRTGTVVGCWLVECGMPNAAAIGRVQDLYSTHMPKVTRCPFSPENQEQRDYIKDWIPEQYSPTGLTV